MLTTENESKHCNGAVKSGKKSSRRGQETDKTMRKKQELFMQKMKAVTSWGVLNFSQ